ncbi:TPA: Ni/Fe hydrogenase subunit gamma [Candidatus Poribacteria bacterium]|nr:Ni/Fe hydrogenase subunit gamma [Candidatus Poribacteria bacterium]
MNVYRPHLAIIEKIKQENDDTRTFSLRFIRKKIRDEFRFKPGQFNMISVFGFGEAPFSISSDPEIKGRFEHTIRRVGTLTNALFGFDEGHVVGVRGPFGNGWPLDKAKGKNLLLIAGGTGLISLRPAIYHIMRNRSEFGDVELLYGARSPSNLLFIDEHNLWARSKNFRMFLTVEKVSNGLKWDYEMGVITEHLDKIKTDNNPIVFLCGPEIMMKYTLKELMRLGFKKHQIYLSMERRMRCGIGKCGHCQIGPKYVCRDGPVFVYDDVENLPDKLL